MTDFKRYKSITLVDLDGTLVKVNTWPFFARKVLNQAFGKGKVPMAFCLGFMLLLRKLKFISHKRIKKFFLLRSHDLLNKHDREKFAFEMSCHFNPDVLRLLEEASHKDSLIVMATAAAGEYAPLISAHAGINKTLCSPRACKGTDYIECRGDKKADEAQKLAELSGLPVSLVITDHNDDLPLFNRFPRARHIMIGKD